MRHYRRNPDDLLQRLRRAAATGGPVEQDRVLVESMRAGLLDYEKAVGLAVVNRGPVYGWQLMWEFPGAILLTPSAVWDGLHMISTPWWDGSESTSPLAVDDGRGTQTPLRDLRTPKTGNLAADAEKYRAELASAINRLSEEAAARAVRLCSCSTFVEATCPTHGDEPL